MSGSITAGVPLVEVVRSGFVECVHHGSVVALRPDGSAVLARGATATPVFPRSSNKPLQAVGMLRCGLPLQGAALAITSGSHSGQPEHVREVGGILARFGLSEDDLGCPPALPSDSGARADVLYAGGEARRITMNCSGKHAGMLATCVVAGWPTQGYLDAGHPLQKSLAEAVAELAGEVISGVGVDGCGVPIFGLTLTGLARAFSALLTAEPGTCEYRVAGAMRANPRMVAGAGQDDTVFMDAVPGLLMKGGAEGVHTAATADGGAVALKIDDGAARARMPVMAAALAALGVDPGLIPTVATSVVSGGGAAVGEVRYVAAR